MKKSIKADADMMKWMVFTFFCLAFGAMANIIHFAPLMMLSNVLMFISIIVFLYKFYQAIEFKYQEDLLEEKEREEEEREEREERKERNK